MTEAWIVGKVIHVDIFDKSNLELKLIDELYYDVFDISE